MNFDEDDRTADSLLQDEKPDFQKWNKSELQVPEKRMTFDDILEELGEFGKFQKITFILICFPILFSSANNFTYVFVAGETEFRCHVPVCDDTGSSSYQADWLPNALPSITEGHYTPAECEMYALVPHMTDLYNGTCSSNFFNQSLLVPCNKWIRKNDELTIVQEWNIYCKDTWKLPLVGSVHFAGLVAGCGIFGFLADRFGRKLIFILCIVLMSVCGVAQIFCTDYTSFLILMLINSFGTAGVYPLAFIIAVELVGKQKRELTGVVLNYFYTVGEVTVGAIAWYFPNWKVIQLVFCGPSLIFVLYWWFIPESIRWLLATRQTRKAINIIEKIAKTNGVIISEKMISSLRSEEVANNAKSAVNKNAADHEIWPCVKEILVSCKMITRFLIVLYIWSAIVFVYYGLSMNSVNMSGNKYLNFMLTSAVGAPGYTLAWMLINKAGRKWTLSGSFLASCLSSVAVILIPDDLNWLKIGLYLCAKMFVSCSLVVGWIYTAELLPTIIRSGGVGFASTFSRIGAMIPPFIPYIYPSITYLPMILFAAIAGLGSILALFLPETKGIKLPETVKEAKSL